jgi:glycosyltransferase involved in cell wall biosynthesis
MRNGEIEDHSRINYMRVKRFNFAGKELLNTDEIKKFELLSISELISHFNSNRPKYLLIRNDTTFAFLIVLVLGIVYKSKIVFYNQYPYFDKNIFRNLYNYFFYKLFKIPSITPVLKSNLNLDRFKTKESPMEYKARLEFLSRLIPSKYGKIWFPFSVKKLSGSKPKTKVIRILTVGKFVKRKNLDLIINFLSNISEDQNQFFELIIAGELESKHIDYFNYINNLSSKLQTKHFRIKIFKNLSHNKVMNLYSNSHYFILLSEKEISSVSQVEAFVHNCKLIISCDNGNLDFLPLHKNYFMVRNLQQFIENPKQFKLNNRLINMDRYISQYNSVFGIDPQVKRLNNLFQSI